MTAASSAMGNLSWKHDQPLPHRVHPLGMPGKVASYGMYPATNQMEGASPPWATKPAMAFMPQQQPVQFAQPNYGFYQGYGYGAPNVSRMMPYNMMATPATAMTTPLTEIRSLEPRIAPAAPPTKVPRQVDSDDEGVHETKRMREDKSDASKGYVERRVKSSSSSDSEYDTSSEPSRAPRKRKTHQHAPGQGGKRRLKIEFLDLGEEGEDPQMCGKSGSIIPHNLRGRHEMHNQPWEFHITHEKSEGITVIKWSVTNLTSGKTVSVTETPFQAKVRQKTGNTITSFVMRQALEQRVRDLEEILEKPASEDNTVQTANIMSLIKDLRKKERNEGILFFGLRHEDVQKARASDK